MIKRLLLSVLAVTWLGGCDDPGGNTQAPAMPEAPPWQTKHWVETDSGIDSELQPIRPRLVVKRFRSRYFKPLDAPIEVTKEYQQQIDEEMERPTPSIGYRKIVLYEIIGEVELVDRTLNGAIEQFAAMDDQTVKALIHGEPTSDPVVNTAKAVEVANGPAEEGRVIVRLHLTDMTRRSLRMVTVKCGRLELDPEGYYRPRDPGDIASLFPQTHRLIDRPPSGIDTVSISKPGSDLPLAFPSAAALPDTAPQLDTPVGPLVGVGFEESQAWRYGLERFFAAEVGEAASTRILDLLIRDPAIEYYEVDRLIVKGGQQADN